MEEETKLRIPAWLYPSTIKTIDGMLEEGNCKSRSELLEKAIAFYAGYRKANDRNQFLPAALTSVIGGALDGSERRTNRMLFKLAVEVSMMANLLAARLRVDDIDLTRLRGECADQVKRSNGELRLEDAVRDRQG